MYHHFGFNNKSLYLEGKITEPIWIQRKIMSAHPNSEPKNDVISFALLQVGTLHVDFHSETEFPISKI
jgi:hypothetical protein